MNNEITTCTYRYQYVHVPFLECDSRTSLFYELTSATRAVASQHIAIGGHWKHWTACWEQFISRISKNSGENWARNPSVQMPKKACRRVRELRAAENNPFWASLCKGLFEFWWQWQTDDLFPELCCGCTTDAGTPPGGSARPAAPSTAAKTRKTIRRRQQ